MKVLIVSPCILPVPAVKGGAVQTLIESLIRQNEINKLMELSIVTSYDDRAIEASSNYKDTNFIAFKENRLISKVDSFIDFCLSKIKKNNEQEHHYIWKCCVVSKLKKVLLQNDYDRVVFQNSGYLLNVLKNKTVCEKYQNKLYYHLHNDIPDSIYKKGVAKCQLIVISNYLSIKIKQVMGNKVNDSIHVLKNGIRTDLFSNSLSNQDKIRIRERLGIPAGNKVVIFAGRITEYKGVKELIEAFNTIDDSKSTLLIIGSFNFASGQTSNFEKEIQELVSKNSKRIICTGYIPYKDIWKYYQLGDVAVLPSMWNEPAGLTMLEAAISGIPLITTNAGGIPEYIDEKYAIFVKRENDIVSVLGKTIKMMLSNYDLYKKKAIDYSNLVKEAYKEEKFYFNFANVISYAKGDSNENKAS